MLSRRSVPFLRSTRLWLIILILLAIPLIGEFNARLIISRQLFEEETRLQSAIADEQARLAFLEDYLDFVNSDAAVEWWARVRARMVKPGEIAVVPQSPDDASAVENVIQPNEARDPAFEWWAAFFASTP
jgi:hypothetical protein